MEVRQTFAISLLIVATHFSNAAIIPPTSITTNVPTGSNSPTAPYTDDILLESITFGSSTFTFDQGEIIPVLSVFVSDNRSAINAESGPNDNNSDGNPDPFDRIDFGSVNRELTDPEIQDLAIASAFSTNSLSEGVDGEGGGNYTFSLIFQGSIIDNDSADDSTPEIIFFERGNNDTSSIRAIIGGTFDNPIFAPNTVTINPGDLTNTGISILTSEINNPQELSIAAFDLSTFGTDQRVFGLEITSNGGDFFGEFLTAANPGQQIDNDIPEGLINNNSVIPEPRTYAFIMGAIALSQVLRRRR